jgi:hypothetical protein
MADNSVKFLSLVGDRQYQVRVLARAHALAAEKFEQRGMLLGVPVIILMTIVGTGSFANLVSLGKSQFWISLIAGILSVTAAVLAALQTFFNYGPKAQKHAEAAAKLNALGFKYDLLWRMRDNNKIEQEIVAADAEMQTINLAAPRVAMSLQKLAKVAIDEERPIKPLQFGEEEPPRRGGDFVFMAPSN